MHILWLCLFVVDTNKKREIYAVQIERLRKEGSRLVAEEQEKLEQQLKQEASQLYNDPDDGIRLRVSVPPVNQKNGSLNRTVHICISLSFLYLSWLL